MRGLLTGARLPSLAQGGCIISGKLENVVEETRTAWHPLAYYTVRAFTPSGYEAHQEFALGKLPQKVDIVILRRSGAARGRVRGLNVFMARLERYNLIEVKGPTVKLLWSHLPTLLGYATQFMVRQQVRRPRQINLFTLSDGIPPAFRRQIRYCGGSMSQVEPGVWEVKGLMFRLFCIDAYPASRTPGNHLLYMFSKRFLDDPTRMVELFDPDELEVCSQVAEHVVQFKRGMDGPFPYEDYPMLKKNVQEALERAMNTLPLERRLAGLTADQLLSRLSTEERLKGLRLEERLNGLEPEELEEFRRLLNERSHQGR